MIPQWLFDHGWRVSEHAADLLVHPLFPQQQFSLDAVVLGGLDGIVCRAERGCSMKRIKLHPQHATEEPPVSGWLLVLIFIALFAALSVPR